MNDNDRWQAVLARDAGKDGAFVYAVQSTGVYCRPSCPSRRPARRRVVFFTGPDSARQAGFRACRRCRPDQAARDVSLVQSACERIAAGEVRLAELARAAGVSASHLQRVFTRVTGVSPRQFADAQRVQDLKRRLRAGEQVTDALYAAGYGASSRLYENAPRQLGMTPAQYRRGARGVEVRYSIAACPLGKLLVAGTGRGVCAVSLGDSETELETALRCEFPASEPVRDDSGLGGWVRTLVAHLEGRAARCDLPLDVRATAFQRRVWEELRRIPYGETRSYGQVARAIGQPRASRAVARACATNPAALVVPCHRVVREDGQAGGYRWGAGRKARLLEREGSRAEAR